LRGTLAKRLRKEAEARGGKPTKQLNPQKILGANRVMRRMEKFQPQRHQDLVLEQDPIARRIRVRRWNWLYSKFRPLPENRQKKEATVFVDKSLHRRNT
jgi:hypothetical protein